MLEISSSPSCGLGPRIYLSELVHLPLKQIQLFFIFCPFGGGAAPARGQIRTTAASLHHSHSNTVSEMNLQPTPQLTAMSDP